MPSEDKMHIINYLMMKSKVDFALKMKVFSIYTLDRSQ